MRAVIGRFFAAYHTANGPNKKITQQLNNNVYATVAAANSPIAHQNLRLNIQPRLSFYCVRAGCATQGLFIS